MTKFFTWLREPPEGPIPALDAIMLIPMKISYVSYRSALRLAIGRTRRDRMRFTGRFMLKQVSPSFYLVKWLESAKAESKQDLPLIKVRVPKHGYQYFCRGDKGNFTPGREDKIVEPFAPAKADVVVDLGAHIGCYTIISSRRIGPEGKVIAIDADQNIHRILDRNIQLNALTNVKALKCAVFSTEATLKLYQPSNDFSLYDTMIPNRAGTNSSYVEVKARTLDSILEISALTEVNWINIDVEGAEYEVIKGATRTLAAKHEITILMEVHDIADNGHYDRITKFLKLFGFNIHFEQLYNSGNERHVIFKKQTYVCPAQYLPMMQEEKVANIQN